MNSPRKSDSWSRELEVAKRAAKQARGTLLSYFGNLKVVEEKAGAGLVSEADRESEKIICRIIRESFPDAAILGEESSFLSGKNLQNIEEGADSVWLIDPLDGTTNFVHGFPIFCISIGYASKGKMVVGVIDVPVLGNTYTCTAGGGAFLNEKQISVSKRSQPDGFLLSTGFNASLPESLNRQIEIFNEVIRKARAMRRPGAAAFDLCMVAEGVFDGFWESDLSPWDTAAGSLLVEEAGGTVCDYSGSEYHYSRGDIIAAQPKAYAEIYPSVQKSLHT